MGFWNPILSDGVLERDIITKNDITMSALPCFDLMELIGTHTIDLRRALDRQYWVDMVANRPPHPFDRIDLIAERIYIIQQQQRIDFEDNCGLADNIHPDHLSWKIKTTHTHLYIFLDIFYLIH